MTWFRVNRNKKCELCGHDSWCTFSDDGYIYCMRPDEVDPCPPVGMKMIKQTTDGGTVFAPGNSSDNWVPTKRKREPEVKKIINWDRLQQKFVEACDIDKDNALGDSLGVPSYVLAAMGLGWSEGHNAYSFPMYSERWDIMGFRLRTIEGKKFAVKGSRDGIFGVPVPLDDDRLLLVAEGPTDTAALRHLGYYAVGRPSCRGAVEIVAALGLDADIVIVADADGPGRKGARDLATRLIRTAKRVRIIQPTQGAKDAREWVSNGITKDAIDLVIANAKELHNAREIQSITS